MKPSVRSALASGQAVIGIDARSKATFVVVLSGSGRPKVLETLEASPGDSAAIASIAARHNAQRLVAVASVADSFAKIIPSPQSDAVERSPAHALAAEAALPDGIASWRMGCGPWPASGGWVLACGLIAEPATKVPRFDLTFAPAAACLAAITAPGPASSAAPGSFGSMVEPSGACCVFHASQSAPKVRSFMSDEPSSKGVLTLSATATTHLYERIVLPAVAEPRYEAAWLDQFGLALGAAILASDPDPLTASLASLRWREPVAAEAPPVRMTRWLATPTRAAVVLVGALVALLLGRWGFAYARHEILASKLETMDGSRSTREALQKRAALYNQLSNERSTGRLPMTKLLHDLSRIAPVGVSIPSLRLSPEQGLVIQGRAEKSELITSFEQNLNSTRMLRNLKRTRNENTDEGVEFELTAEIVQPHNALAAKEDFAATPLAVRLYGENATDAAGTRATAPASGATAGPTAGNPGDRSDDRSPARPARAARAAAPVADAAASPSRRPSAGSDTPPPPLATEDIAKLPRGKVVLEFGTRKGYLQKNEKSLDAATKERLAAEVERLRARMDETRGAP